MAIRRALIFDEGDEAKQGLTSFAVENDVTGASLTAIGAFQHAVLTYVDRGTKQYLDIPVDEQVEVLSLVADIALRGGGPMTTVPPTAAVEILSLLARSLPFSTLWLATCRLQARTADPPGALRRNSATATTNSPRNTEAMWVATGTPSQRDTPRRHRGLCL